MKSSLSLGLSLEGVKPVGACRCRSPRPYSRAVVSRRSESPKH